MQAIETWNVVIVRHAFDCVEVKIYKPNRVSPVYAATRETAEKACVAALNGASIAFVPGIPTATVPTKAGRKKITLAYSSPN
jgi:hypothetical protein